MKSSYFQGFLSLSIFFLALSSGAADVHLEHSYFPEGSSWGTDGAFKGALNLPESDIPTLYKTPAIGNKPTFIDVSKIPLARGRFLNDRAVLFKNIRLCLDLELPQVDSFFLEAKETFLDNVAGKKSNGRLLDLEVIRVSPADEVIGKCDIIVVKGQWGKFPYRYLPDSSLTQHSSWLGKIYGLFYRWNENSIPVITVHPDIELSYSPAGDRYVSETGSKLEVDGRVLLFHEIGHILGFAHINPDEGAYDYPEATVMGIDSNYRDQRGLKLRFELATNLWKFWDAYQATIFRRVLQRELNPTCTLPPPSFIPLQGRALDEVLFEFNLKLDSERPWGAYSMTAEMVKASISNHIKDIPREFCAEYRSIFAGTVPENSEFKYFSGARACTNSLNSSPCRYYFPRLYVWNLNFGYSLYVGRDVIEGEIQQ